MINNPLGMLLNVARKGMNPQAMLFNMARNNPQINQFLGMVQGKSNQELQTMAQNIARERGIDINSLYQQLNNIR